MSEDTGSKAASLPDNHIKVDRRYRESRYFLQDQLRYAESIQEFRSIKQAIHRSAEFNLSSRSFQFVPVAIASSD